jgi:hypothetical protein
MKSKYNILSRMLHLINKVIIDTERINTGYSKYVLFIIKTNKPRINYHLLSFVDAFYKWVCP